MEQQITNQPKKDYPIEMHTTEHILNQTMVRMFGCSRSMNAHIERKKSKCDYTLFQSPTLEEITQIENIVNSTISQHLPVTEEYLSKEDAAKIVDLNKLPSDASETLRIVRIGEYDACACIGAHVRNTEQIGHFKILSNSFEDGTWRVRFKVESK